MSIRNDPPMDAEISDLYKSTQNDGPSVDLDAAILAQAEAAVVPKRRRPVWIAPVGLAATLFLGVNLAVNLKDYSSAPDIYSQAGQSVAVPTNQPESQVSAETVAAPDDSAKDYTSNAPKPAAVTFSSVEPDVEQDEKMNKSGGRSETDMDVGQLLRQMRQEKRDRSSEAIQQQIERFGAKRELSEQKKQVDGLLERSVRLDEPELRKLSRSSNAVIANSTRSDGPMRDVTEPVAETLPSESNRRLPPPKSVVPVVAPPARASTLPRIANPVTPPAPIAQDASDSETEESEFQEVIVTGSRIPGNITDPSARLSAKEPSKRNESEQGLAPDVGHSSAGETAVAAKPVSDEPDVYVCDLEVMNIDADNVESAKVDARNLEPPLDAVSWPGYIRNLAEQNNYVQACTHLAVYQQLYPDIVMIEILPLTIPKQK